MHGKESNPAEDEWDMVANVYYICNSFKIPDKSIVIMRHKTQENANDDTYRYID